MALQGTRYYFPYLTIPEYDELRDFETGSFFDNLYVSEEEIENSSLLLIRIKWLMIVTSLFI